MRSLAKILVTQKLGAVNIIPVQVRDHPSGGMWAWRVYALGTDSRDGAWTDAAVITFDEASDKTLDEVADLLAKRLENCFDTIAGGMGVGDEVEHEVPSGT